MDELELDLDHPMDEFEIDPKTDSFPGVPGSANDWQNELGQFSGSDRYYRDRLPGGMCYHTEGVQFLAEHAGCFWLISDIVIFQDLIPERYREFQVWRLRVVKHRGILTCEDGNGTELYRRHYNYTDFPLPEIVIYLELGSIDGENEDYIMMLPSER